MRGKRGQFGSEARKRRSVHLARRFCASTPLRLYASALLLFLAGCGIGSARKTPSELRAEKLAREKAELVGEVQQYRAEIEQLRTQIQALSALPKGERENPYKLTAVRIARTTNFYDTNNDGRREKLIVYIQPIDTQGDIVKAAGTVDVQLWDLNLPNGQAQLGHWQVGPTELHRLWFDFLVTGYRLTFDRPKSLKVLSEPLTIRITFTDYLTGESFRDQRVIEPQLD